MTDQDKKDIVDALLDALDEKLCDIANSMSEPPTDDELDEIYVLLGRSLTGQPEA
jgi:hypothetical protein